MLKDEQDGLTTAQIAHALKSLDDELITWDNPTLVGRICAIIGVNRQNRFYRDGKVVKLKKAE